jgi:hypothetical protein
MLAVASEGMGEAVWGKRSWQVKHMQVNNTLQPSFQAVQAEFCRLQVVSCLAHF